MSGTTPINCWAMRHWRGFIYPFSIRSTRKECISAWEQHTGRADAPYGRMAPNRPIKVIVSASEPRP